MSFRDLKVGDKILRVIGGGGVPIPSTVMFVEEDILYVACKGCEDWPKDKLWKFDRDIGCEEDEELGWGKKFRVTGSQLLKIS